MGRAEDLFKRIEESGEAYLDELIAVRKSEEAFLDFKQSANDGESAHLHDRDNDNLTKAISGFANSEGGVIVWGIDARGGDEGDVAQAKKPLSNAPRFASLIDNAISGRTVPPVQGVRSIPIVASGQEKTKAPTRPEAFDVSNKTARKWVCSSKRTLGSVHDKRIVSLSAAG